MLRIAMGMYFLYAGLSKIIDPAWSAVGYLSGAKTFTGLFEWFALPQNIGWVNFMNEWGLTLIGIALLVGLFSRVTAIGGALFMLLYYFPVLNFPYAGPHGFIVDEHILWILIFVVFYATRVGRFWGLDYKFSKNKN